MQITDVKTFLVEGVKYNWALIKIETGAGIHGWGEATNWPGSPLIEAACQHVGRYIIGQDARPIENGYFVLPERPGLGFDVGKSVLARHPGLRTPPTDRTFYV